MSSLSAIAATVVVFIVAALLYFQSHPQEGFVDSPAQFPYFQNASSYWNPSMPPIAGRRYNPDAKDFYMVPADLSKALVVQPSGSIPLPQQRPNMIPGPGNNTREASAQLKDLRELDNKIMVWLDAASQKDREQVGSMTPEQLQSRVMLQARLADVREQLGTGIITDSWKKVADEISALQKENIGWQAISPSLDAVYSFGLHKDPNRFLTKEDYTEFFGLLNTGILELQSFVQPNPIQKIRLQQLQVIRQDIISTQKRFGIPPIKLSSAQMFLRQMMQPDQPLPTLFSIEPSPLMRTFADSPLDILSDLSDIQWKLTVEHDPASQELKRSVTAMVDKLKAGAISPEDARSRIVELKYQNNIAASHSNTPLPPVPPAPPRASVPPTRRVAPFVDHTTGNTKDLMTRAKVLCSQIREAFPLDADALGCRHHISDNYEAETVINTVCDRIRYSVPTVSPEQFNCPPKTV
jgi:hypothetical protein